SSGHKHNKYKLCPPSFPPYLLYANFQALYMAPYAFFIGGLYQKSILSRIYIGISGTMSGTTVPFLIKSFQFVTVCIVWGLSKPNTYKIQRKRTLVII